MLTLSQALLQAQSRGLDRLEAQLLLLHALGKSAQERAWLLAHDTDELPPGAQAVLEAGVRRRTAGEPLAYITGHQEFFGLDLAVDARVLVPRPDTETLVEWALDVLQAPTGTAPAVLDLGTGSGAIALSLARELPRAQVVATDASAAALAVAARNARRLGIANARFVEGDWLVPLAGQRFDLIASNPPYIETGDPHLAQGDLRFEPATALASGSDGLDDIRRIVADAIPCLQPGGWLLFEHGWKQGEAARALLRDAGYTDVSTAQDLEGRDRVSGGRMI